MLLAAAELAFYTKRGEHVRAIVGSDVVRGREFLGSSRTSRRARRRRLDVVVATEHGSKARSTTATTQAPPERLEGPGGFLSG